MFFRQLMTQKKAEPKPEVEVPSVLVRAEDALANVKSHLDAFKEINASWGCSVKKLQYLFDCIDAYSKGETVDFNAKIEFEYKNYFKENKVKDSDCLKIAAGYCEAIVLEYLLQHGAKPYDNLIHLALRSGHPDDEERIAVLKKYGVNINDLNKDGHTELYKAKSGHYNSRASALSKHHARLTFSEQISLPLEQAAEKVMNTASDIANMIIAPYPR